MLAAEFCAVEFAGFDAQPPRLAITTATAACAKNTPLVFTGGEPAANAHIQIRLYIRKKHNELTRIETAHGKEAVKSCRHCQKHGESACPPDHTALHRSLSKGETVHTGDMRPEARMPLKSACTAMAASKIPKTRIRTRCAVRLMSRLSS